MSEISEATKILRGVMDTADKAKGKTPGEIVRSAYGTERAPGASKPKSAKPWDPAPGSKGVDAGEMGKHWNETFKKEE